MTIAFDYKIGSKTYPVEIRMGDDTEVGTPEIKIGPYQMWSLLDPAIKLELINAGIAEITKLGGENEQARR